MHRLGRGGARSAASAVLVALAAICWGVSSAPAQSLTAGSLKGEVTTGRSQPVSGAQITLENQGTGSLQIFRTNRQGRFLAALIAPGTYSVLAEQIGYQPVRQSGVRVFAGQSTDLRVELERRPPPITSVKEIPELPRAAVPSAPTSGEFITARGARGFDRRRDATDLSREAWVVDAPRDGRAGFAFMAGGFPQSYSRLVVDGLPGTFLRHPFAPREPASTPVYSRDALDQAQIIGNTFDSEWPGSPGSLLSLYTRRGTNRFTFQPFFTWSGSGLGGSRRDNPADSTANSIQTGGVVSGALVQNVAQFTLALDYQSLELPATSPLGRDSASFNGGMVPLGAGWGTVANDSFGTSIRRFTQPTVRSYRGGSGFARTDWRLSDINAVMVRFGYATWKERNSQLGEDLVSGVGGALDAHDLSGAVTFTSVWPTLTNEFRAGIRQNRRDWSGGPLPATYLVAEESGIGASPLLPGDFRERAFDFANTVQINRQSFQIKLGLVASFTNRTQDYLFGRNGIFWFGDLDQFGQGQGSFFQSSIGSSAVQFTTKDYAIFGQYTWLPSPGLQVIGGLRWDRQALPFRKIARDTSFEIATGLRNDFTPQDKNNFGPRLGVVWDVKDRHEWLLRGGAGVFYTGLDPNLFGETVLYDGNRVRVRRGQGSFGTWPLVPDTISVPNLGSRLTILSTQSRDPRTLKLDAGVSRALASDLTASVNAEYHHTDYLARRTDLNRLAGRTGTTQEGRPVYGTLVQQGALVSAAPGSNRRIGSFDLVSGLAPTGFSDYYEVTVGLQRSFGRRLAFAAAYSYSHTRDNWSPGLTGDPADQLSPFPEDPAANEWVEGRSDFDIPHRFRLSAEYRMPGRLGLTLGARYRLRSGYPYTPGFQPGVDANGDGSGYNDPAFVNPAVPGLAAVIAEHDCLAVQANRFAERNSCRQKMNHALDLHGAIGLPVASLRGRVELTLDAFNVVSTATGIPDRALVLIDPSQAMTTDPSGNVTLPLIANPKFGTLLSRRGENRLIRFGLRLGY